MKKHIKFNILFLSLFSFIMLGACSSRNHVGESVSESVAVDAEDFYLSDEEVSQESIDQLAEEVEQELDVASAGVTSEVQEISDEEYASIPSAELIDEEVIDNNVVVSDEINQATEVQFVESVEVKTQEVANYASEQREQVEYFEEPKAYFSESRVFAPSVAATVRASAFESQGRVLNAYHFVRQGDSWSTLSQRLYGSLDSAEDLKLWNQSRSLKAGHVIYYASPFREGDSSQMLNFYEDFQIPLQSYKVSSGDSLSIISKRQVGSHAMWAELLNLNASLLQSPDSIEVGQLINLPNHDFNTQPKLAALMNAQPVEQEAVEYSETAATEESMSEDLSQEDTFDLAEEESAKEINDESTELLADTQSLDPLAMNDSDLSIDENLNSDAEPIQEAQAMGQVKELNKEPASDDSGKSRFKTLLLLGAFLLLMTLLIIVKRARAEG